MDREVLKQKLSQAANNKEHETDDDIESLLLCMLPHIGDHDPELRDKLIYGLASSWITQGLVSPKAMNRILEELLTGQYLSKEEKYTRSFTTLWIAALLYRHRKEAFLTASAIERVFQALLTYTQQEHNGEGYDKNHGWAHTLAHAADALDELILLTELSNSHREQLVKEIINKMAFPYHVLSHEEDERMTIAVHSALQKGLSPDVVKNMVKEKTSEVIANWTDVTEENLRVRSNFKQFIRSLYFCLSDFPALQDTLLQCEQLFSGIYHNKSSS